MVVARVIRDGDRVVRGGGDQPLAKRHRIRAGRPMVIGWLTAEFQSSPGWSAPR